MKQSPMIFMVNPLMLSTLTLKIIGSFINKKCGWNLKIIIRIFRSGCFGSYFFQECMASLIVDAKTKNRAGMIFSLKKNFKQVDQLGIDSFCFQIVC